MSFAETLACGLIGESEIAQWLIARHWTVLPAYEVELASGKGLRLYTVEGPVIAPDMLVFNSQKVLWVECKTKSAFTWYRQTGTFQTGIDLHHWKEYQRVQRLTPFDIWILFLHRTGQAAKDTPTGKISPSGLFGNTIDALIDKVDHASDRHGSHGMVYWNESALRKITDVPLRTSISTESHP